MGTRRGRWAFTVKPYKAAAALPVTAPTPPTVHAINAMLISNPSDTWPFSLPV
ncbi:hypothetical protein [Cohnella cholangitidis]|uniref:hypothetical protein n=1 Tax=Cohnella cholangitidis TaxID=2598458 RepID=UPI001E5A7445|nr:hypothetical protein [Cohnella cholangitidis]